MSNEFLRYRRIGAVTVKFSSVDSVIGTLEGQVHCASGDAILTGINGENWPVARMNFDEMYEPDGNFAHGVDGRYRKKCTSYTLAKQMDEPFTVKVWSGDILTGKPGDWLTQHPDGQQGIVNDEIFRKTHQQI